MDADWTWASPACRERIFCERGTFSGVEVSTSTEYMTCPSSDDQSWILGDQRTKFRHRDGGEESEDSNGELHVD